MRKPLNWIMRQAANTMPKLVFQVIVSVSGTLCAAFISNAYLMPGSQQGSPPPSPPPLVIDAGAAASLMEAHFTAEGFRLRPTHPLEFAAVYGPSAGEAPAGTEESTSPTSAPEPSATPEIKPEVKPTRAVAQACSGECGRVSSLSAVFPPRRPATLANLGHGNAVHTAESAGIEQQPVRLLGVPLPGFVPSGEKIVKTVVTWADSITAIIPGM